MVGGLLKYLWCFGIVTVVKLKKKRTDHKLKVEYKVGDFIINKNNNISHQWIYLLSQIKENHYRQQTPPPPLFET